MSVGFGFSVGDFLAGIQLVRDVISSLQASGGSAASYQGLAFSLFSLERALLEVKTLGFGDQHYQQSMRSSVPRLSVNALSTTFS